MRQWRNPAHPPWRGLVGVAFHNAGEDSRWRARREKAVLRTFQTLRPKKVPKSEKEKKLEQAVTQLQKATHFKFLVQLHDEFAQQITPLAKRSSVAVIVSESALPQQFHSDKADGGANAWSHSVHGHGFSTVTAIGQGVQTLNYIENDKARQLELPPGVAVFLGPQAVHAGSSTSGIRIHCTYDVKVWTPTLFI